MDGGLSGTYEVRVSGTDHPVIHGLLGNILYYGSDIDSSTLIADGNTTVLAWAQLPRNQVFPCSSGKCERQPVIVAHGMNTP